MVFGFRLASSAFPFRCIARYAPIGNKQDCLSSDPQNPSEAIFRTRFNRHQVVNGAKIVFFAFPAKFFCSYFSLTKGDGFNDFVMKYIANVKYVANSNENTFNKITRIYCLRMSIVFLILCLNL